MATQTSNLGLTKPGYDEAADVVPAVNNNMDILDEKMGAVPANTSVQAQITANAQAIAKLDESIAIVSNGNTHAAIAAGQYVYIKGHETLAEGLYTANSAISANATLSNSNVTAVSGGGLNALNSKIALQAHVKNGGSIDPTKTLNENVLQYLPNNEPGLVFFNLTNTKPSGWTNNRYGSILVEVTDRYKFAVFVDDSAIIYISHSSPNSDFTTWKKIEGVTYNL
jgi:hypothetical protein